MYKEQIKHVLSRIVIVAICALLLETFVFNMNYFRSANYDPVNLEDRITLDANDTGTSEFGLGHSEQFKFTESNTAVDFYDLNKVVNNIHLDFDNSQPAQNLKVKISFTDAAHETYFSTTEYTFGVPEVDVSTASEQSQYLYLESSGAIQNLRIEITSDDASYPVVLNTVVINERQPFEFNSLRYFLTFTVLLLLYVFRPKSSIYRCQVKEHPRFSRAVIVFATACEIFFLTTYLLLGSNQVGIATANYNSGSWDGHSIVNTYKVGGENAQQYAELAKAMSDGQLYLEIEPPQWLVWTTPTTRVLVTNCRNKQGSRTCSTSPITKGTIMSTSAFFPFFCSIYRFIYLREAASPRQLAYCWHASCSCWVPRR